MRKADYAALAAIIREKLNEAHDIANPNIRTYACRILEEMAHAFSNRASVNRAEFLKACGIEP